MKNKKKWAARDQLKFHQKRDCVIFDFGCINYLIFSPLIVAHLCPPIPGLPDEVANVRMAYTGVSNHGGLPRVLTQVFRLHYEYAKKVGNEDYDEYLAGIYEETVMKGQGLYVMLVRNSSDYQMIQTSEYNGDCFLFRSTLLKAIELSN